MLIDYSPELFKYLISAIFESRLRKHSKMLASIGRKMCMSQVGLGVRLKHTIYALSSGFGKCGVAVIRISGPEARVALTRMCKRLPPPRHAELKKIKNPETDEVLDHGLVLWFPGPASFTGEDCCELQVHGGSAVLTSIFTALSKLENYRPAEPGEFTRRAFYSGKFDLTSVEGLADLINAETEYQRKQAIIQMNGALYEMYSDWRSILSKCLANVEAYIDFEEDQDIESSILHSAKQEIKELHIAIQKHLADGCRGERLRSGVNMTIAGAPNVGKSSLLNFLSKKQTAIVSDIPGTTRDIVKSDVDIGGYPVNIQDTAGLRKNTSDVVELEGISRARAALEETDLILVVLDAQIVASASNLQAAMINISSHIDSLGVPALRDIMGSPLYSGIKKCIVIVNKMDLIDDKTLIQALKMEFGDGLCPVSCKTKEGMDEMMQSLSSCLKDLCGNPSSENPCFTQPRHRYCLEETCNALTRFSSYTDAEVDLAAQEMRNALYSLGKITGHVTIEDILDIIFKEFCIGK